MSPFYRRGGRRIKAARQTARAAGVANGIRGAPGMWSLWGTLAQRNGDADAAKLRWSLT
jgi:hypothetical protein